MHQGRFLLTKRDCFLRTRKDTNPALDAVFGVDHRFSVGQGNRTHGACVDARSATTAHFLVDHWSFLSLPFLIGNRGVHCGSGLPVAFRFKVRLPAGDEVPRESDASAANSSPGPGPEPSSGLHSPPPTAAFALSAIHRALQSDRGNHASGLGRKKAGPCRECLFRRSTKNLLVLKLLSGHQLHRCPGSAFALYVRTVLLYHVLSLHVFPTKNCSGRYSSGRCAVPFTQGIPASREM